MGDGAEGQREWQAICGLLTEQLPRLQSRLLDERSLQKLQGASPQESHQGDPQGNCETNAFERLLLESVSNGSVGSKEDIQSLLRSTLLYYQVDSSVMVAATLAALEKLKGQQLMHLQLSGSGQSQARTWQPTEIGLAVYSSSLPTGPGKGLYRELDKARASLCLLDGGALHLVFVVLGHTMHPVALADMRSWGTFLRRALSDSSAAAKCCQAIANKIAIDGMKCERMAMGRIKGQERETLMATSSKLFTALVLADLVNEVPLGRVVEKWGALAKDGLTRGQLQKLQSDLAKAAAMAGQLAASAGWWSMESLLNTLAAQAVVGTKPELVPLMKVQGMTALQARALFNKGITGAKDLAEAPMEKLREALQAAAPSDRRRKNPRAPGAPKPSLNALGSGRAIERTAEALLRAALQHLMDAAQESASAAAGAEAAAAAIIGSHATEDVTTPPYPSAPPQPSGGLATPDQPQTPLPTAETGGIRPAGLPSGWTKMWCPTEGSEVSEALLKWRGERSWGWAVACQAGGSPWLAVQWRPAEVLLLELSGPYIAGQVRDIFTDPGQPGVVMACWGLRDQLVALRDAGVDVDFFRTEGLEDGEAAASLLGLDHSIGQPDAQPADCSRALTLEAVLCRVEPGASKGVRLSGGRGPGMPVPAAARAACHQAISSRVAMSRLRVLLDDAALTGVYRSLCSPLARLAADMSHRAATAAAVGVCPTALAGLRVNAEAACRLLRSTLRAMVLSPSGRSSQPDPTALAHDPTTWPGLLSAGGALPQVPPDIVEGLAQGGSDECLLRLSGLASVSAGWEHQRQQEQQPHLGAEGVLLVRLLLQLRAVSRMALTLDGVSALMDRQPEPTALRIGHSVCRGSGRLMADVGLVESLLTTRRVDLLGARVTKQPMAGRMAPASLEGSGSLPVVARLVGPGPDGSRGEGGVLVAGVLQPDQKPHGDHGETVGWPRRALDFAPNCASTTAAPEGDSTDSTTVPTAVVWVPPADGPLRSAGRAVTVSQSKVWRLNDLLASQAKALPWQDVLKDPVAAVLSCRSVVRATQPGWLLVWGALKDGPLQALACLLARHDAGALLLALEAAGPEMDPAEVVARMAAAAGPRQATATTEATARVRRVMSWLSLSEASPSSSEDKTAADEMDDLCNALPAIRRWLEDLWRRAARDKFVVTLMGRRQLLPVSDVAALTAAAEDSAGRRGNRRARRREPSEARRRAAAICLAGSSADLVNCAAIATHRSLSGHDSPSRPRLLVVSRAGELVLESPPQDATAAVAALRDGLQRGWATVMAGLSLPVSHLSADVRWGESLDPYASSSGTIDRPTFPSAT